MAFVYQQQCVQATFATTPAESLLFAKYHESTARTFAKTSWKAENARRFSKNELETVVLFVVTVNPAVQLIATKWKFVGRCHSVTNQSVIVIGHSEVCLVHDS